MSETSFIKRFDITLDLKQPGCGGDFSVVDGEIGRASCRERVYVLV